jgi:hypothetical protein
MEMTMQAMGCYEQIVEVFLRDEAGESAATYFMFQYFGTVRVEPTGV